MEGIINTLSEFENNVENLNSNIEELKKRMLSYSNSEIEQLRQKIIKLANEEAERILNDAKKESALIQEQGEKNYNQIKNNIEKNYDKAIDKVISMILGNIDNESNPNKT